MPENYHKCFVYVNFMALPAHLYGNKSSPLRVIRRASCYPGINLKTDLGKLGELSVGRNGNPTDIQAGSLRYRYISPLGLLRLVMYILVADRRIIQFN
jgi:hypothetical protein